MVKNKLLLAKEYNIGWSEVDAMPYYEYEWVLEEVKEIHETQVKQQEKQQQEQQNMMPNTNALARQMQQSTKLPSLTTPKFNFAKL